MRFSIPAAVALLAVSTSALAQLPPPRHYDNRVDNGDQAFHPADDASAVDGPGSGLQLELNVFREAGTYSTNSVFSIAGTASGSTGSGALLGAFLGTLQPLASIGYQWDQNALLLGVGIAVLGGVSGSGSIIIFGVTPTYRRYMSPLRTGKITPFAEGAVTISLISIPGSGTGSSAGYSDWGLGVALNCGAEWLFVRNFGLYGKVGVNYGHLSVNSGPSPSPSENIDAAGIQGDVGLAVHF